MNQLFLRDEPDAAIVGIGDRINIAHAPRLAQVGTAGQHPSVEEHFNSAQPQKVVVLMQRMIGRFLNPTLHVFAAPHAIHTVRQKHATRQFASLLQARVGIDRIITSRTIGHAGETDRVVIGEQILEPARAVFQCDRLGLGLRLHEARRISQDAGRLSGGRVFLDLSSLPVGDLEVPVDATEFQRERVARAVRSRAEDHRVLWSGRIEFPPIRISLIAQSRDEDLRDHNPVAVVQCLRPRGNVFQHIADRVHLGDRVIELIHRRTGSMNVRIT